MLIIGISLVNIFPKYFIPFQIIRYVHITINKLATIWLMLNVEATTSEIV